MAKFIYNNAKNASFVYTSFELNYRYYSQMFYKNDIDLCSKSKLTDKLLIKLRELMIICRKNFYHTQKL